jgi:hypothetical protein
MMRRPMSVPRIPGFTDKDSALDRLWSKPAGDYPDSLWPKSSLREIRPNPTGWLIVAKSERHSNSDPGEGIYSVLVNPDDVTTAMDKDSWVGSDLGSFGIIVRGGSDEEFVEDGLASDEFGGLRTEFLCRARYHHGLTRPTIEFHLPFLWYWDAIPRGEDWYFLDQAGRDHDLIRVTRSGNDGYIVAMNALPLRKYLARMNRILLVQHDVHRSVAEGEAEELDANYRDDWCSFSWYCRSERYVGPDVAAFSRLLGKYAVRPAPDARGPRMEERAERLQHPDFIIGSDPTTGEPVRHTCDPDQLGTYFDKDSSRLHYLTPVYFRPEVLARYTAEPKKYRVRRSRLSCLELWGLDIGRGTTGQVEVYLGDLGNLPPDEWPHWLSHNEPPMGDMSEDRFRRDILNQIVPSPDLVAQLHRAHEEANSASTGIFGRPLWRDLPQPERIQYERLHGPVTDDPLALQTPILTLCKALVDSLDTDALRSVLADKDGENRSLALLDELVERAEGDKQVLVQPLRDLYALRSRGGIAHLPGKDRERLLSRLGVSGLGSAELFDEVVRWLIASLKGLTNLFNRSSTKSASDHHDQDSH